MALSRLTLATCYQLAQSVLKIGFALAKKKGGIGGGGWIHPRVPCTWQLPWLARESLGRQWLDHFLPL